MKIDVSDLLKSIGAELKVDRSEKLKFSDDNLDLISPVNVKLKLVNTGETVLVTGSLRTDVKIDCSRCLKEFELPVNIKVEEEYSRHAPRTWCDKEDGKCEEFELKDKDFVFEISENNIIDLDEVIRQNLIVNLPVKPLCSKSCKLPGYAAKTGKTVDPRLEKLGKLILSAKGGQAKQHEGG